MCLCKLDLTHLARTAMEISRGFEPEAVQLVLVCGQESTPGVTGDRVSSSKLESREILAGDPIS